MKKRIVSLIVVLSVTLGILFSGAGCTRTQYTVWFDGNGGTLVSGEIKQLFYSVDEIEPPVFEKAGYRFIGWDVDISKIDGNTTVNAQWDSFIVTFNGNGGELISGDVEQQVGYGSEIVPPVFVMVGYDLSWDVDDFSKIDSDTTINAVWTIKKCQLILGNGLENIEVTYGEPIGELPVPEKEGANFGAWAIDGNIIGKDTIWIWEEDKTAEAIWLDASEYVLRLDYNGGDVEIPNPNVYISGEDAFVVNNPTKEGYNFIGWSDVNDEDSQPIEILEITLDTTGDKHYIATWQAKTYTLALNLMGGELDQTTYTVEYDAKVGELPIPELEGCSFIGWYLDGELITSEYRWKKDVSKTLVLDAVYSKEEYIIRFQTWCVIKGEEIHVTVKSGDVQDIPVTGDYVIGSYLPTGVVIQDNTDDEYWFYGWTINDKKFDGSKYAWNNENKELTVEEFLIMLSNGNDAEEKILKEILQTGIITIIARSSPSWTSSH